MLKDFRVIADKYNRVLAELSMISGRNMNKPAEVCCRMTMRCNSRCVHCDIWKKTYDEELTTQQWIRFFSDLSQWAGNAKVILTGGEALLRPDMLQILEYVVRRGFKVELLSNGLIFNDFLADRIAAIGLNQITFSFDGTDAQTHDTFRGVPGGYAKTVAAVSALDNYRTIHRTDFTILLKTVVNRTNVTQLSKNAEWARKHGAEILFQPIEQNYDADTGDNWYKTSPHWITDLPVLENEVQKLISLSVPQGPVCNTKDSLLKMVEYFKKPDELMHMIQDHDINTPKEYCRHAVYRFDVSSSGDVRMCFRMEPCGNIKNQSPKQIWENRKICWAQPCDFR